MRYSTISQIGAFTALSASATDWLMLNPANCSGGADAPLRTDIEPVPGGDGALIFPPLDDAWVITLSGELRIRSASDESGFYSALDTLLASLKSALATLKTAPGNLVHSGGTLSIWKYSPVDTSWAALTVMTVTFGVVVDVT